MNRGFVLPRLDCIAYRHCIDMYSTRRVLIVSHAAGRVWYFASHLRKCATVALADGSGGVDLLLRYPLRFPLITRRSQPHFVVNVHESRLNRRIAWIVLYITCCALIMH